MVQLTMMMSTYFRKALMPWVMQALRINSSLSILEACVCLLLLRTNLHVVLCLSPVGETFRERCRMFPGLVNCTTIDWFTEWPTDALYEVATRQMASETLGTEEIKQAVCKVL
eukprot:GHRR01029926.1.p1 GENE.GHRR01029926.1~~GHRR01029926.1.p1  ORF type:complete len:113 (-),score=25.52 GHRR01029926.1:91-429(-)